MRPSEFKKLLIHKGACAAARRQFERDRKRWRTTVEGTLARWIRECRSAPAESMGTVRDRRAPWLCWAHDMVDEGKTFLPTDQLIAKLTPKKLIADIKKISYRPDDRF